MKVQNSQIQTSIVFMSQRYEDIRLKLETLETDCAAKLSYIQGLKQKIKI